MKLDLYLTPYTKINSKWVEDINIRAKTIKLLEENIGINLHDLEFGNGFFLFLSKTKAQATIEKLNKLDLIKIKKFCSSKDTKKVKRQPTKLEKVFAHHISGKGLVSKIHKECLQFNNKKTKKKLLMGKQQMGNKNMKRCSTSLVIREMQIKTTVRDHFTPTRIGRIRKSDKGLPWWSTGKESTFQLRGCGVWSLVGELRSHMPRGN